jgi:signal transduction histidine kinase
MTGRGVARAVGIRVKLSALLFIAMLALAVATAGMAAARQRATLEDALRRRGLALAADLAAFAVRPWLSDDLATLRRFVNHTASQEYVRYVALVASSGRVVMHSDLEQVGKLWKVETRAGAALPATTWSTGAGTPLEHEPIFVLTAPIGRAGPKLGTVILGYSRTGVEAEISLALRRMLTVGAVAAVIAGSLAYLLAAYISAPILRIARAMRAAPADGPHSPLPENRSDEIGFLSASFNAMAADLARHRRHMDELVADRTAELTSANRRLETEIADRGKAEAELLASRQALRGLAAHLQSVREDERTTVAREIHDELGQALTALKMDVHWLRQRLEADAEARQRTGDMSSTIDGTIHTVRRISSSLRPKLLDDLGVSAAIEWAAREFEDRCGIECDVRSEPDDVSLDSARSTALFRVFQETLTNVARHAGASRVDVVIRQDRQRTELVVADNGTGITSGQAVNPRSLGIVGMRERVLAVGGTLDITGEAGVGTVVRVMIPSGTEQAA